ncbi:MAG: sulfotransferase [Planctomycetota bacterium]
MPVHPITEILRKALTRLYGPERAHRGLIKFGRGVHAFKRAMPGLSPCRQVFFISGFPRSGTNWVCNLLNLHPQIYTTGEYHFYRLRRSVNYYTQHDWEAIHNPRLLPKVYEGLQHTIERVLLESSTAMRPFATVLGDRSPGPLELILPGAKSFWIVRDGRDVAVSWTFHMLRMPQAAFDTQVPAVAMDHFQKLRQAFVADPQHFSKHPQQLLDDAGTVEWIANDWAMRCRDDAATLDRLGNAAADVLPIIYEELHADLQGNLDRMYRFLGVEPSKAEAPSEATRTLPGFKNENPLSHYRSGRAKAWAKYFGETARRVFHEQAGDVLIAKGYETNDDWVGAAAPVQTEQH